MKHIMLLGDSIRMYYEPTVRELLAGWATVWTPGEENGGTTRHTLSRIDQWLTDAGGKVDLVHVNCGLHDLATERAQPPQPRVPVAEYETNVAAILARLKASGAKVIWATITPVNEKWHTATKPFERYERDVDAYNAAGLRTTKAAGVAIDDLNRVVTKAGRDSLLTEDGVHFTPTGSKLLGEAVARVVRDALK